MTHFPSRLVCEVGGVGVVYKHVGLCRERGGNDERKGKQVDIIAEIKINQAPPSKGRTLQKESYRVPAGVDMFGSLSLNIGFVSTWVISVICLAYQLFGRVLGADSSVPPTATQYSCFLGFFFSISAWWYGELMVLFETLIGPWIYDGACSFATSSDDDDGDNVRLVGGEDVENGSILAGSSR